MLVHEGKTTRATVKRVEGSMHGNGVINPFENWGRNTLVVTHTSTTLASFNT